jgi:hypothetical protein
MFPAKGFFVFALDTKTIRQANTARKISFTRDEDKSNTHF